MGVVDCSHHAGWGGAPAAAIGATSSVLKTCICLCQLSAWPTYHHQLAASERASKRARRRRLRGWAQCAAAARPAADSPAAAAAAASVKLLALSSLCSFRSQTSSSCISSYFSELFGVATFATRTIGVVLSPNSVRSLPPSSFISLSFPSPVLAVPPLPSLTPFLVPSPNPAVSLREHSEFAQRRRLQSSIAKVQL